MHFKRGDFMQKHLLLEELKLLKDEDLVVLAQQSSTAFDVLIARHLPLAKSRAFKFLNNNLDIDDLISEVTFGLLSAARNFNPGSRTAFTTFAVTCIDRRLLDLAKSAGRKKRFKVENRVDISDCEIADFNADPQIFTLQKYNIKHILNDAKTILSPLEFDVLIMAACGYSYSAIAVNLKMNVKSVDNALARARKKLAQTLKIDKIG